MVIANRGTQEVLWVNPSGRVVRQMGRRGEGPGEFGEITNLRPVADGIVAWDRARRRLTSYSDDGELRWVAALEAPGAWQLVGGESSNDLVLVRAPQGPDVLRHYVKVDSTGTVRVRWAQSGHPRPVIEYSSRHPATGELGMQIVTLPDCMPQIIDLWSGGILYEVDTGGGTIKSKGYGDAPDRILYRSPWRLPLGDGAAERIRRALSGAPSDTVDAAFRRAIGEGGHLPVWRRAIAGHDGFLFLERASCARRHHPPEWDVITTLGDPVGSLELPLDATLAGASRRWLAVVMVDSLDVERIEVYRIGDAMLDSAYPNRAPDGGCP